MTWISNIHLTQWLRKKQSLAKSPMNPSVPVLLKGVFICMINHNIEWDSNTCILWRTWWQNDGLLLLFMKWTKHQFFSPPIYSDLNRALIRMCLFSSGLNWWKKKNLSSYDAIINLMQQTTLKTRCDSSKDRARFNLHLLCSRTQTSEDTQLSQNNDGL